MTIFYRNDYKTFTFKTVKMRLSYVINSCWVVSMVFYIYIFLLLKNSYGGGGGVMWGQHIKILAPWIMRIYLSLLLRPVYTRGDTRASSPSPPVWATATCASDGHPVIDEVSIHRHSASCNRGASLSGQLSVLRWGWVYSTLPHHLVTMLTSD